MVTDTTKAWEESSKLLQQDIVGIELKDLMIGSILKYFYNFAENWLCVSNGQLLFWKACQTALEASQKAVSLASQLK